MENDELVMHDHVEENWESDVVYDVAIDKWTTLDFYNIVKSRRKVGLTEATFDKAIQRWHNAIHRLPKYDEAKYLSDISSMDIDVPHNEHDFSKLEIRYSEYVSYLVRLNEMAKNVRYQYQTFDAAYKSLKSMAAKLSSGTVKDKEANAEFYVQEFLIGLVGTKNMLDVIEDNKKAVDFCSITLNRILKEREDERVHGINPYTREGQSHKFENMIANASSREPDLIPTRKKIGY